LEQEFSRFLKFLEVPICLCSKQEDNWAYNTYTRSRVLAESMLRQRYWSNWYLNDSTYQIETAEGTLSKLVSCDQVHSGLSELLERVDFHVASDKDVCKQNRMDYSKVLRCFRRTAVGIKVYLGHAAQSGFWNSSCSGTQRSNPLLFFTASRIWN